MRCPACGVETVEQAVYCHKCGERIDLASQPGVLISPPTDPLPPAKAETLPKTPDGNATRVEPEKGVSDQEKEVWRGGYSSKAMIGGWFVSAMTTILFLVLGISWGRGSVLVWLILLLAMLLPWLYHLAVLCYRRMSVHYVLTTQRLIHELGVLRRVTTRLEVLSMDDITFEQSLLERLVGVGTICISSADRMYPHFALHGIENVRKVTELFDEARRSERRRQGLQGDHGLPGERT